MALESGKPILEGDAVVGDAVIGDGAPRASAGDDGAHPPGTPCAWCGYDLGRAEYGACPECGRFMGPIEHHFLELRRKAVRGGRVWVAVLLTALVPGVCAGLVWWFTWSYAAKRAFVMMAGITATAAALAGAISLVYPAHFRQVVLRVTMARVAVMSLTWLLLIVLTAGAAATALLDRFVGGDTGMFGLYFLLIALSSFLIGYVVGRWVIGIPTFLNALAIESPAAALWAWWVLGSATGVGWCIVFFQIALLLARMVAQLGA